MKRVRPAAAWPVAAIVAAAAVALTSCGVSPTGVIQAGGPATVQSPSITLYFFSNGRLVAIPRQAAGTDVATAVSTLFAGPTANESAKNLVTELPALRSHPVIQEQEAGAGLTVRLPQGVAPLSGGALQQLVCTVATGRRRELAAQRTAVPVPVAPTFTAAAALPTPTHPFSGAIVISIEGTSWHAVETDATCPAA